MSKKRIPFLAPSLVFIATLLFGLIAPAAHAQTFKVLYDAPGNGGIMNPSSRVMTQGRDGNIYATSINGGTASYGTLFKVSPAGQVAIVYSVGYFVVSGATLGSDGNFYGTNQDGGPGGNCGFAGCGQVYKITPNGVETILYNFTGFTDGNSPQSAPIQATDGKFYGTTPNGTAGSTVYSVTPSGAFTSVHQFSSTEGSQVMAELFQGSDGQLYGTAQNGGANGDGTIFKMTLSGTVTVLHSFDNSDGANPNAGLIQASDGNFYGTTPNGGDFGYGVVFQITPDGTYTVLHSIDVSAGEGARPGATLAQGSDSKLYGVTTAAGGGLYGTIFNITTSGTFTTLYTFCTSNTCTDGSVPLSPVRQSTNGIFYGTTSNGGDLSCGNALGCGVVYSLNVGLKPFVSTVTSSGKEGSTVGILGQSFTSASTVSFGGIPATKVTYSRPTFLTAMVPAGALTGSVVVTTGTKTLTSAQAFRITPVFTKFSPPSGGVGISVRITGTGLTQTTAVTFNGTAAAFTVNSDTQVTATVPSGASTGLIVVTTQGGSVIGPRNFTVN
jgi:uncharacterized repeat protein (TIGR03803 family)